MFFGHSRLCFSIERGHIPYSLIWKCPLPKVSAWVQCTFIKPSQTVTKSASFNLFNAETGKPEHLEGGLRATLKPNWRWNEPIHCRWQDFLARPLSLASSVSSAKSSQTGTPYTFSAALAHLDTKTLQKEAVVMKWCAGASILENWHG